MRAIITGAARGIGAELARGLAEDGARLDVQMDLLPLVRLLIGPGGRYIIGQTLAVDGGRTMLGS